MKIENVKLEDLHPLESNVRKHGDKQIAELIKSLNQFGQTRAFVVDENNTILIGNGMYEAMRQRGDKTGSVYRVTGLSEKEKKKLILSDNRVYTLGADDFDNIEAYLKEITDAGDFDVAGYDEDSLRMMTRTADEILDDVMSYGVIDTKPAQPAAQEASQQVAPASYQPTPPAEQSVQPSAGEQYSTPAETIKTIICPNCGEVIRL